MFLIDGIGMFSHISASNKIIIFQKRDLNLKQRTHFLSQTGRRQRRGRFARPNPLLLILKLIYGGGFHTWILPAILARITDKKEQ